MLRARYTCAYSLLRKMVSYFNKINQKTISSFNFSLDGTKSVSFYGSFYLLVLFITLDLEYHVMEGQITL